MGFKQETAPAPQQLPRPIHLFRTFLIKELSKKNLQNF